MNGLLIVVHAPAGLAALEQALLGGLLWHIVKQRRVARPHLHTDRGTGRYSTRAEAHVWCDIGQRTAPCYRAAPDETLAQAQAGTYCAQERAESGVGCEGVERWVRPCQKATPGEAQAADGATPYISSVPEAVGRMRLATTRQPLFSIRPQSP